MASISTPDSAIELERYSSTCKWRLEAHRGPPDRFHEVDKSDPGGRRQGQYFDLPNHYSYSRADLKLHLVFFETEG
eukprot:scaffold5908_cov181-Pinguiococcus_pyrenoidosus.AAC.1